MINRSWNRNFHSHYRLIEIFGLSNEYLPNEVLEINNKFILKTKNEAEKNNFFITMIKMIINFIKSSDSFKFL